MKGKKNRYLFHSLGVAIVTLWLVMMGLLIKRVHFQGPATSSHGEVSAKAIDSYQREWKEIYLKDKKVGYSVNTIKPFDQGYYIQEEIFLKLNLMGLATGLYTVTQCQVDQNFLLKSFHFSMTSGAVAFKISGRVEGDQLLVTTGKGKEARTQRIQLTSPPMIGVGLGPFFRARKLKVGDTFHLPVFDPSTMAQKEMAIHVVAREPLKINRRRFDAFRLETEMWGKVITFWLDEDGNTLKEEGFMGLTTIKSSAANAPRNLEAGGSMDFYEMTAVEVNKRLQKPRRSSYLKLKVEGIEKTDVFQGYLEGGRQRFKNGIMEIRRETAPVKTTYRLPYDGSSLELRGLLDAEFNIESDDKGIISQARQIVGKEKDPLSAARKLMKWVYVNLEKKPVVSVPSAREVLRTRVGDCNEHATLLTALLRALKIPSRLSIGLIYSRGKFFYHAWTEAYVGQWISMDATLNQIPADATHIKFLEGNLDKQVEIVRLIGNLKLKVVEYKYD